MTYNFRHNYKYLKPYLIYKFKKKQKQKLNYNVLIYQISKINSTYKDVIQPIYKVLCIGKFLWKMNKYKNVLF